MCTIWFPNNTQQAAMYIVFLVTIDDLDFTIIGTLLEAFSYSKGKMMIMTTKTTTMITVQSFYISISSSSSNQRSSGSTSQCG